MTSIALTVLQVAIVNAAEWIIIIAIVVLVFFGAKKIPELAKSFGRATTEFEKARIEAKRDFQRVKDISTVTTTTPTNVQNREKLESVANKLGINHSELSDDDLRSAIQAQINRDKNKG